MMALHGGKKGVEERGREGVGMFFCKGMFDDKRNSV